MKNQYFADVHDYRKYGLLRALESSAKLRILVAWMLTPDDGGSDGARRSYLQDLDRWHSYDPELFTSLQSLAREPAPGVELLESSGLLPNARFYSEVVPDAFEARLAWRSGLLQAAAGADLVFLDPDNGIQVPSLPVGRKDSSKYVAWDEIEALWACGCSLLVYQHFRREDRRAFAARLAGELRARVRPAAVECIRTSDVLYLLAIQPVHADRLEHAIRIATERWKGQIDPMQRQDSTKGKTKQRTDEQGLAYAGSQRQIQTYVTEHAAALDAAVTTAVVNAGGNVGSLRWVAPIAAKQFAEPKDAAFLEALELARLREQLGAFWPSGGPVWDGLALAEPGPCALLVEAKSYPEEMYGPGCQASSEQSLLRIQESLDRCRHWVGADPGSDWKGRLYQYANRLAHIYFLREICGIEAWLINVCFIGDPHRPTSLQTWQRHLREVRRELGFPTARVPFTAEVFLPAIQSQRTTA